MGAIAGAFSLSASADVTFSGEFGVQQRYYLQDALYPTQPRAQGSLFLQPSLYTEWNEGYDSLVFTPFVRLDQEDSERSHADIRELLWLHAADNWELRVGIGKVFWGQTESLHLVDIINQTDAVESVDGEDKLGQPMVSYTWLHEYGSLSAYVLPYFRERTFSGLEGRLRPPVPVNTDKPLFESDDEESNVDFALRWQQSINSWEVGVSFFHGTNREPELIGTLNEMGEQELLPFYRQINQVGIDVLNVSGDWLWKFEAIYRAAETDNAISPAMGVPLTPESEAIDYFAAVGGFEYTLVGFMETTYDLGILMEYQYDERDNNFFAPAQNDLMLGVRWALNDQDSTEVLVALIQDLDDTNSRGGFIEASSRMTQNWRWTLEGYFFAAEDPLKPLYFVRQDDHIQFGVEYFF
ncbi:hypothetical protein DRW07_02205 [Alteromonas sediminis]|uniref:TonB-dependent receptor n=2 Tax=Alteromonas sediminis TaxID=2259342 RepID=A0A3N5ZBQ7_9ALTE|nr:hypothetical protein DRW07_02205 [Alteromonas sediminis]